MRPVAAYKQYLYAIIDRESFDMMSEGGIFQTIFPIEIDKLDDNELLLVRYEFHTDGANWPRKKKKWVRDLLLTTCDIFKR